MKSCCFSLFSFFLRFIERLRSLKVSVIRSSFTLLSRGVSLPKEGEWFTSISQGLSLLSNIISKPNTSKHREFSVSSGCSALNATESEG